ncbi:MAG: hypothetical protein ABEI86_03965 [Halobacteriaceae archaeon]
MEIKASGKPANATRIDEWHSGFGWIAYPDELIQRASHGLIHNGGIWLIDPLLTANLESMITDYGEPVGIVILSSLHTRDAVELAKQFEIPIHIPESLQITPSTNTITFSEELADTGFKPLKGVSLPWWQEVALYDGDTLLVGDMLGTAPYFTARDEEIGIHPLLRLFPPSKISKLTPERILTGHGAGIMEAGTEQLQTAFNHARLQIPQVWANGLKLVLKSLIL